MAAAGDTEKGSAGPADEGPRSAAPVAFEMDDGDAVAIYANFCRVASTPEEVILDLALNPNPMAPPDRSLKVAQRVILNHYTAKRLAALLTATVQRHEQAFGVLETDVRKRVVESRGPKG
jgi:hypothetical protein